MTEYASRKLVPGDRPLRRDMRLLGWHFRRLLQQHGPEGIWQTLHRLRELAERRREGDPMAEQAIADTLAAEPLDRLGALTRSMGLFFDLANLAEDRHRVRVLRRREAANRETESIAQAIEGLRSTVEPEELRSLVRRLRIEPVFTAHPTEAKRRTVRRALRRLRRGLYQIDRSNMLPADRRLCLQRMRDDLLVLWSTDSVSSRKPTVDEELDRTVYAVRTLWRVGPRIMAKLRKTLASTEDHLAIDRPIVFGNWIGGDRDGNPFVTAAVTQQTLARLRRTAVTWHRRTCRAMRRRLTVSADRMPLSESMKQAVDDARRRWPQLSRQLDLLHPHEWMVHWLTMIEHRLKHSAKLPTEASHPMRYADAQEFQADVGLIGDVLRQSDLGELADHVLQPWQDQIQMFGLHLLRLDIRVNSKDLRVAIEQLLHADGMQKNYREMDERGRRIALEHFDPVKAQNVSLNNFSGDVADLLDALTLTQRLAQAGAAEAIGQFIVSMTHEPSDVLALIRVMEFAAVRAGLSQPAAIPVAPLFETIQDLKSADALLQSLIDDPVYQRHLQRCTGHISCMVGYSDSAKDGGYLASNWALFDAQRRLAARARGAGATLTIFHGRGGALGRGGGPAARAITSLPHEAVNGRLRITEQGEVIAERYDDPAIAARHLEQLTWATLKQSAPPDDVLTSEDAALAAELSDLSMQAYRRLIESPGFEQYLRQCTVLPLIETMALGSRPSRRTGSARLEDLRAIPFTFAWNQVRMPINAFFGMGSAFEAIGEAGRRRAVELYERWPWFRAVIDNAELALARCDSAITRRYANRSQDTDRATRIWRQLRDEYDASLRAIIAIKQERSMIEHVPWLRRTIRVRNPYLDMLNLVQLELLSRLDRDPPLEEADAIKASLRLTVQAIAAGLRNTG